MKIRTDFVTNSSSSSFVVEFTINDDNDSKIVVNQSEYDGDYEGFGLTVNDLEISEETLDMPEDMDESEFYEDVGNYLKYNCMSEYEPVNVEEFFEEGGHASVKELISSSEEDDEDEDYDDGEEAGSDDSDDYWAWFDRQQEESRKAHAEDSDEEDDDVEEAEGWDAVEAQVSHIKEDMLKEFNSKISSSSKVVSVSYEFGGRGEGLLGTDEILGKMYGDISDDVYEAALSGDFEELQELLPLHSESALGQLISFVNQCDGCVPSEASCKFTMNEDGEIELEYTYTE